MWVRNTNIQGRPSHRVFKVQQQCSTLSRVTGVDLSLSLLKHPKLLSELRQNWQLLISSYGCVTTPCCHHSTALAKKATSCNCNCVVANTVTRHYQHTVRVQEGLPPVMGAVTYAFSRPRGFALRLACRLFLAYMKCRILSALNRSLDLRKRLCRNNLALCTVSSVS